MSEDLPELKCPKRIIFKRCKQKRCAWWLVGANECATKSIAVSLINLEVIRAKENTEAPKSPKEK